MAIGQTTVVLLKSVSFMLVGYLALLVLVYVFQRQLTYYPSQGVPNQTQLEYAGIRAIPDGNGIPRGYVGLRSDSSALGTIIILHGNAGSAAHRTYYLPPMEQRSYRVVLAEYVGYGSRPGSPTEDAIVQDICSLVDDISREFPGPVYLWGESLGAGVAAAVANASATPISGLVLLTPFDTLPDLGQSIYWFLPVKWLAKDHYNSIENLTKFNGPTAVVLAEHDEVIPIRHGRRLYESISHTKQLWTLADCGHNSWLQSASNEWWDEVLSFMSSGRQ